MSQAVKTAFLMNICIFVIKAVAAFFTRSAGMMAEAIHSLVDSVNQLCLMLGTSRSKRGETKNHPFGQGKEQYFWAFIVAMMLFVLGGVYSMYEGIHKILHPEQLKYVYLNLAILGVSVLLEAKSWYVAKKELGVDVDELLEEVVASKDANTVVVFVEDTGALFGLGFAFIGTVASFITGNPLYDALSSCAIGALLFVVAFFLANEMRKLVIGEAIEEAEVRYIRRVINRHPAVKEVGTIKTMQMGNNACIVAANVDFQDDLRDHELEVIINDLKDQIRVHVPDAGNNIFLQPQDLD